MTAPSYGHDLTTIDEAQGIGSGLWAEPTATGWTGGGSPANDADYPYIQTGAGSYHSVLQATTKSGLAGLMVDCGAGGVSLPTDGAFLLWQLMYSPPLLENYAAGGLRAMIGSGLSDFTWWSVGGSDVGRNPYGGFQNHAINPNAAGGTGVGSPSGTLRYVGVAANLTAGIGKGYPHIVDVARYGRCEARFDNGEEGNPATLAGFAALNDAATARWGLISVAPGGYSWKGLITIGYSTACRFEAANTMVLIEDQRKVTAGFNKIEVRNGSDFILTNVTIQALGTASKGRYETVSGAAAWDGCNFVDMDSFALGSSDVIVGCIFRRCGQVTQGGASISGCTFARSTAAVSLAADTPASVTDCVFISDGNGHAIEGFSTPGATYDVSSHTFTGYAASDGSSGDEALHVLASSGEVTINYSGTQPSVKSDGATVTMVSGQKTLTIKAAVSLYGAEIRIYDLDDTPAGSLGTELDGTESCPSSTFGYTGTIGNEIWIQIMLDGYVEFGQQVTMPDSNSDFVAQLVQELNE